MSYQDSYDLRYKAGWLLSRGEVSMVNAANYVTIEDPNTPEHANRLDWAYWAQQHSQQAINAFLWPLSLDPTIMSEGNNVTDAQIDAVISAALPGVIADFIKNPPK